MLLEVRARGGDVSWKSSVASPCTRKMELVWDYMHSYVGEEEDSIRTVETTVCCEASVGMSLRISCVRA